MATQVTTEVVEGKTADDLFETYSIEDVRQIISNLSDDITSKKQRLKLLVGNKYRDLLHVADDIIQMNGVTRSTNDLLMDLAFADSDYNSKKLSNLSTFNQSISQENIRKTQSLNRPKVLGNIVHDLNYTLMILKHKIATEVSKHESSTRDCSDLSTKLKDYDNDFSQTIPKKMSDELVTVAKQIYLIHYFFKTEMSIHRDSFAIIKYKQLLQEFTNLIKNHLTRINHESDSDFFVNLSISYMISNRVSLQESIDWILNARLEFLTDIAGTALPLKEILKYVYMTLEYVDAFKSRIPVLIAKLQTTTSNSDWICQTSFRKWVKWLRPIQDSEPNKKVSTLLYDFDYEIGTLSRDTYEDSIMQWKNKVASLIFNNLTSKFHKSCENLNDLVLLLQNVLISFKYFTSLTDLLVGSSNIVDQVINEWGNLYIRQLRIQLSGFDKIKDRVVSTFRDSSLINNIMKESKENILYEFSIDFAVSSLIDLSGHRNGPDEALQLLDVFILDTKSILSSIELLNTLSIEILKPVLSIDDTDDDEFWGKISSKVKIQLSDSIKESASILSQCINRFYDELSKLIKNGSSTVNNENIFYIVHVLVQLEQKLQLKEIYNTLSKAVGFTLGEEPQLGCLIEPLLEDCFETIVQSIYKTSYKTRFETVFIERFQNEETNCPEMLLWDVFDNKKFPTVPSTEASSLLLQLCFDVTNFNGLRYSKYFSLPSFERARKAILYQLIDALKESMEGLTGAVNRDSLLLAFSDYTFIRSLININELPHVPTIDNKFVKLDSIFSDPEYCAKIEAAIVDNMRTQYLMYYPFSV